MLFQVKSPLWPTVPCVQVFDVLKILALGADLALIGRPLAQMTVGGGEIAVEMYLNYVKDDLLRAMILTGCDNLGEIRKNILVK